MRKIVKKSLLEKLYIFGRKIIQKIHPSWCFYAGVWGIIAGLIFGVVTAQTLHLDFAYLVICLIIFAVCLRKSCLLTLIITFVLGVLVGNCRVDLQFAGREVVESYQGKEIILAGTLSEDPDTSKGTVVLRLKNLKIYKSQNVDDGAEYYEIAGTMYASLSSSKVELERSDRVLLKGKLGSSFGTFVATMYRPELVAVERTEPGDIFAQAKHWFAAAVREVLPSPEVDLGLGYLMGMKTGLSEEFSEALRAVGMTHVVVASGAHLGILAGAAKKLFGRISKFAGTLMALLLIGGFVMVVGFTPSMTRAALVASLSLIVGYVGRKFTPLRLISFVAMLTLLIDPMNFLNLGWQLSFASFFGILVFAPRLQEMFYGGKKPPWLASMLITSLATCLICAPILIYSFGSLSLLAFVANLIILPTLPYVMFLMLFCGVASFWPGLARIVAVPTKLLLDLHIFVVNYLSEKTMFILNFAANDARCYILYIVVLLILVWPVLAKIRKSVIIKS